MKNKIFPSTLIVTSFLFLGFVVNPNAGADNNLKVYVPDDLKIELWAVSPMLYNPTNMDTDLQGRISVSYTHLDVYKRQSYNWTFGTWIGGRHQFKYSTFAKPTIGLREFYICLLYTSRCV